MFYFSGIRLLRLIDIWSSRHSYFLNCKLYCFHSGTKIRSLDGIKKYFSTFFLQQHPATFCWRNWYPQRGNVDNGFYSCIRCLHLILMHTKNPDLIRSGFVFRILKWLFNCFPTYDFYILLSNSNP